MATTIWKGDAATVAKEQRATPANVEVDDIFTLTCAGESVSFTATAATVANVTAGLATAWNASTVTEHEEITASDETTYLKLLGDTAGVDFTVTASTTEGGGNDTQTLTMSTETEVGGPNVWDDVDNWTEGSAPGAADVVILENNDVDILYRTDQSAVAVGSLTIKQSYTGNIGLPETNDAGYVEYRGTYLQIKPTTVSIGQGTGNGSGRIKLDFGSAAGATVYVYDTGSALDEGLGAVMMKGTHADNAFHIMGGTVSVAPLGGEATTLATYEQTGGTADVTATLTTVTVDGGTMTILGTSTVTTLNTPAGMCYYESSGTVTTLNGYGGAVDCSRDVRDRTFTNINLYYGAILNDPYQTITMTNGFDTVRCDLDEVTLHLGKHRTYKLSAI